MKKIFFMIVVLVGIFSIVGCEKNEEYSGKKVENSRELNENEITDLMNVIDDLFYIDYYNKDVIPRTLTNQEVLRISYEVITKNNLSKQISFKDLEIIAMNYLGFGLEPESLICDTHYNIQDDGGKDYYIYDVSSGNYIFNNRHQTHSNAGLRTKVYNKYVSGFESEGTYTVVVNKLFSQILGDSYANDLIYYKSYEDAKNNKNELFKSAKVDDHYFDDYSNYLINYTYTFNLVDGNYVLTSYDIG